MSMSNKFIKTFKKHNKTKKIVFTSNNCPASIFVAKKIKKDSYVTYERYFDGNLESNYEMYVEDIKDFSVLSQKQFKELFNTLKSKKPKNKTNYVGVELEFISTKSVSEIAVILSKAGLSNKVQVKTDGSIEWDEDENEYGGCGDDSCESCYDEHGDSHNESDSEQKYGIEINVLDTQKNIKNTIKKVCSLLSDFTEVNDTCGLHVHLDARNRDVSQMYKNLYQSQGLLYALTEHDRANNTYCQPVLKYLEFTGMAVDASRYVGINTQAFSKFKTIEVRIMSGSMEYGFINTYLDLLFSVVDKKQKDTSEAKILKTWKDFTKEYKLRKSLAKNIKANAVVADHNRDYPVNGNYSERLFSI